MKILSVILGVILGVFMLIVLTEALVPSGNDATISSHVQPNLISALVSSGNDATTSSHVHPHVTLLSQFTTNEPVTSDYEATTSSYVHPHGTPLSQFTINEPVTVDYEATTSSYVYPYGTPLSQFTINEPETVDYEATTSSYVYPHGTPLSQLTINEPVTVDYEATTSSYVHPNVTPLSQFTINEPVNVDYEATTSSYVHPHGTPFSQFTINEPVAVDYEATTSSHGHPHGTPLNIMKFTTNESVTVDYDQIDKIFLHPEVKDRKIVVISIIGAFRKGKSFFMDYCLRYMYAHYKSVNFPKNTLANKRDWIGSPEAPLIGFSWKAGPHRHTSGIVIWSDVFLHENLAIILMDTQGLFDSKTSAADNSRIFALGTLVSSFQIFNLNDVIEENQLEYLQMATDYANFVAKSEKTTSIPFQNLMFLIRDWSSSQVFPFGMAGGSLYLSDVLRIRDNQSPELKNVRNYIMSSFENVFCFLMPHPGLEVVSDNLYDGRFSRLGDKFQDNLKLLLEWMLDSSNLKIKTILGSEVTGHDFNGYFKSYFEKFQSPDVPKIPSIYEATIERQYANFLDTAMNAYKKALKEYQPNFNSSNFNEALEKLHKKTSHLVILGYDQQKKMGTIEHEKRYRAILEKDIMAFYNHWKEGMLHTHKTIDQIETRNIVDKQRILSASEARFTNVTGKLEAEKQELLAKHQTLEQEIQLNIQLKDKEKEDALNKIRDEMTQQNIIFENERQQIIADQKREYESILTESENRRLKAEDEVKQAIADREKSNAEFQMKLRKESDERFERIRQEAKEREKDRKMEEDRRAKEDADRADELRLLREQIDDASKARQRELEEQEKRREEERQERIAFQIIQNQRLAEERIEREQDRILQQQQFQTEIDFLKRNSAATTTPPNLFCITFAVGVLSVLMFHK